MKFVILCSARGTVMEAVLEKIREGELHAECLGLITDKADRGCTQRAASFGIPIEIVEMKKGEARETYDKRLHETIDKLTSSTNTQNSSLTTQNLLIACMGWQWILSPWFVHKWTNRILNVHPALLPKHPGAHAHDLVLAAKEKESGMTIHLIDEGMDTGKILLQKTCPVLPDDTVDTLRKRVQALECEWYPKVLEMIEQGQMRISPDRNSHKSESHKS